VTSRAVAVEHVALPATFVGRIDDAFTERPPSSGVTATLEILKVGADADPADPFRRTDFVAGFTPHGHLYFNGLRAPRPGSPRVCVYRVTLDSPGRRPVFPTGQTDYRFVLSSAQQSAAIRMVLIPGPDYPYPPHLPVARGVVTRAGRPVADVNVSLSSTTDRCATDEEGRFSLCLRRARPGLPVAIRAIDRTGSTSSQSFPSIAEAIRRAVMLDLP
jgi:hypothetical protein